MDTAKLNILQHSLGLDEYGRRRGDGDRNYFVTGPGDYDFEILEELVVAGFMVVRRASQLAGGDNIYTVTASGKQAVIENSPSPPVLSRSKRRYQAYLNSDTSHSFLDWVRSPWGKAIR